MASIHEEGKYLLRCRVLKANDCVSIKLAVQIVLENSRLDLPLVFEDSINVLLNHSSPSTIYHPPHPSRQPSWEHLTHPDSLIMCAFAKSRTPPTACGVPEPKTLVPEDQCAVCDSWEDKENRDSKVWRRQGRDEDGGRKHGRLEPRGLR